MANDNRKYDLADFQQYYNGKMSLSEQHHFEKTLLEDPFFSEAYQGFEALQNAGGNYQQSVNNLQNRLSKRINSKDRTIFPAWISAAAAVLVVVSGIVWLGYLQTSEKLIQSDLDLPVKSDSILATNTPAIERSKPKIARTKKTSAKRQFTESELAVRQDVRPDSQPFNLPANSVQEMAQTLDRKQSFAAHSLSKTDTGSNENGLQIISGQVIDGQKQPLAGVSIVASDGIAGTTDKDGRFVIPAKPGDSLRLSFIGYKSKIQRITDHNPGNINMEEDTQGLSEVVAVGYGKRDAKKMAGAPLFSNKPMPAGGWDKFYLYLAEKNGSVGSGKKIEISFTVSAEGILSDFRSKEKGDHFERCVELIKKGPEWIPAKDKQGIPVTERISVKIPFL